MDFLPSAGQDAQAIPSTADLNTRTAHRPSVIQFRSAQGLSPALPSGGRTPHPPAATEQSTSTVADWNRIIGFSAALIQKPGMGSSNLQQETIKGYEAMNTWQEGTVVGVLEDVLAQLNFMVQYWA